MNAHWMIFYTFVFWRKMEIENEYVPIGMVLFFNSILCNHSTLSHRHGIHAPLSMFWFAAPLKYKDVCHHIT